MFFKWEELLQALNVGFRSLGTFISSWSKISILMLLIRRWLRSYLMNGFMECMLLVWALLYLELWRGCFLFLFFSFYFLSCFSFHNLRDINSSNILYKRSLGVEPSPLTLDEEWRLMLVPKLWFFLVGGLKTKGKRDYGWN